MSIISIFLFQLSFSQQANSGLENNIGKLENQSLDKEVPPLTFQKIPDRINQKNELKGFDPSKSTYQKNIIDERRFRSDSIQLTHLNNSTPLSFGGMMIQSIGVGYGILALHKNSLQKLNISTKNEIIEDHPHFQTHIDNYLQFSPAAAVVALNMAGVRGLHPFKDELAIYGISNLLLFGLITGTKQFSHELRPDGSGYHSFPSGHTATAFAAAEWLRIEYRQTSPWIGVAGYAAASTVGVLRVYNNRHWVSDVIAGAAIGYLSTRITYAVLPWIKKHF